MAGFTQKLVRSGLAISAILNEGCTRPPIVTVDPPDSEVSTALEQPLGKDATFSRCSTTGEIRVSINKSYISLKAIAHCIAEAGHSIIPKPVILKFSNQSTVRTNTIAIGELTKFAEEFKLKNRGKTLPLFIFDSPENKNIVEAREEGIFVYDGALQLPPYELVAAVKKAVIQKQQNAGNYASLAGLI